MAFYLATVFIGSIYPIFTEVIGDAKISVGPPFYNIVIIPLVIPFLIFMALGPKAKWIKNYVRNIFFGMTAIIFAIIINFLINYYFKSYSILSNLIIVSSIFLILYSLKDLIEYYRKNISFDISRIISHLGFGLLVFFIGINHNFSIEKDFNLKEGEKKIFDNYIIEFKRLKLEENKNYKAVIGEFDITDLKKSTKTILFPEIRIYSILKL